MEDGDGVIFFNFRADRARELTRAITEKAFNAFPRETYPTLAGFVCMTPYDDKFELPAAFEKPKVHKTLGEIVSQKGWKQLRIAETPEMSAREVTDALLKELSTGQYAFAVVNFANPDMVGHTGNLRAAIEAVEVVDACLGRIVDWIESNDALGVITADHGNCELMLDEKGMPVTSHSLLPVPFILVDKQHVGASLASGGRLCDIAPTLLDAWGVPKPPEMTGKSLLS
jgi:2,3-bisphosphoglycerate-independent phosphoglycerate mutase